MIRHQKGQSLLLYGLLLIGLIALMGLAVDGGMLVYLTLHARGAVSNACIYAADVQYNGGNATTSFYQSLAANNVPVAGYQPTSGSGTGLIRGITIESKSIRTAIRYQTPTYFMQIVGIRTMTVSAHARCSTTGQRIEPIAVKYKDWQATYNTGKTTPLLGQGVLADVDSGNKYRGSIYTFMWCVNSATDMTPNKNCPWQKVFPPLTVSPPSSQDAKNALAGCWNGIGCNGVLSPIGADLPIVEGTSNAQLVKSARDAGLLCNVNFVAMIYNGTVNNPAPGYGNWDNVTVMGYAIFTVTDPCNKPNANTISGKAITQIVTNVNDLFYMNKTLFYPEEIPWNASTGW